MTAVHSLDHYALSVENPAFAGFSLKYGVLDPGLQSPEKSVSANV